MMSSSGSSSGGPQYSRVRTGDFDESGYEDRDDGGDAANGTRRALQLKMREQDANLDILGSSVARLGDLSLNISKEIEMQNRMLEGLEAETDSARDKVDLLTKKTREIIKSSGGTRNFCIVVFLVVVLIILTLLVIYT